MKASIGILMLAAVLGAAPCGTSAATDGESPSREPAVSEWQQEFGISGRSLVTTGRNSYFILEPGYQLVFESEAVRLVITVLDDTLAVSGLVARVVEEREWEDGELIEVSRNLFALDEETKDVFYFGEDVDIFEDGKVIGHGGSWRADSAGNRPGLIMSGAPKVGMKYYQELAPGVALDRAEVISLDEQFKTSAGSFKECLKTQEGSALKPEEKEFKVYAPGIGLVQDGDMLLVKHGFSAK